MTEKLREALAKNMKARRGKLGLSQAKLAELAGVSVPFIGEIEIGRKNPSLGTLEKIALALGVQPWELIVDEWYPPDFAGTALTDSMVEDVSNVIREKMQTYRSRQG